MKKLEKIALTLAMLVPSVALGQPGGPTVDPIVPSGDIDFAGILDNIIGWLLAIIGGLAVIFIIIGGIQYIVSAGNAEKSGAAKKTILYALLGLAVVLLAWVLIAAVTSLLNNAAA